MDGPTPADLLAALLPRTAIRLEGLVPDLCLRIGLDRFRPSGLALARVVRGTWAGKNIDPPESSEITLKDGALHVELEGSGPSAFTLGGPDERSSPALLALQNGLQIESRIGVVTSTRFPGQGRTLTLYDWTIRQHTPIVWVGVIPNEFIKHTRTNLVLGQASSANVRTSTMNLRLHGNYLWNLIGADNEVVAVIDPGPRELDRSLLVADFCAVEFACGVPLSIPGGLIGLDANGTSVAWMSASAFVRELYTREIPADPPVPNFLSTDASCWVAEFFQSLAKEFASPGERASWVAFGSYLASLYEDIDSRYLKLHVALEAICHEVPRPGGRVLVRDSVAWKRWVEEHSEEIARHASDSEAAKKLVNKVMAAENAPATDIVEESVEVLGLTLPAEIMAEVKGRNRSVHRFLMNSSGVNRNLLQDWDRVRKLRALLAAVLAKRIGYEGQLSDWKLGPLGHALPADWWPQRGGEVARKTFAYVRMLA